MRANSETRPQIRAADLMSGTLAPLGLSVVAGRSGLDRPIQWPRVQKPGLAIAGCLEYVKENRVQILGQSEFDYLATLSPAVERERLDAFTKLPMSCVVVTKGI
ncbi:MAG: HPr kinase/phosphorylase, partial [Acidobacteria bacterium]|nr:HPr kinase/phosphorylase [Acidobacteriota bacterium]